jgi:outer membrane beta-barrel protein
MLFRGLLAVFAVLTFCSVPRAYAAPNDDAQIMDSDRDEYDFSWLDPDKKIYVVQNRKFTKANHLELSTSYGIGMSEAYRTQRQWIVRGTFYFSEHWGISGFYFNNYNSANDNYGEVESLSHLVPAVRDTNTYLGGSIVWVPFYGKINLFNQIFYIDWDFELGVGSANTQIDINQVAYGTPNIVSGTYTALHWGSGWKFIIDKHWGARFDFLQTHFSAPNGIVTGSTVGSATGGTTDTYNNYYLTLGVSYLF